MSAISRIDLVMAMNKAMDGELKFRASYQIIKRMRDEGILLDSEFEDITKKLLHKYNAKVSALLLEIT